MSNLVDPQEFYLVIHGEIDAHAHGLICGGGWDPPLNSDGLKEARKLAKALTRDKCGIKIILSSPLLRCIQTTDVLHDVLKVKVRVISGLAERNLGHWEKAAVTDVSGFSPHVEQVPGGESLNRFRARVKESIDFALDTSGSVRGSALLVSHEFYGRTLLGLLAITDQPLERCVLYRLSRERPGSAWHLGVV